ncbi:hypothetical protein ACTJNK_21530 [Achromobacter anxifer]
MPLYTVLQPIKAGGKLHRPGSESVELDASVADDLVRSGYLGLAQGAEQAAVPPNEPTSESSAAKPPAGTPPKMEGKAGQKAGNKAATPRKVAAKKSTPAKPA